MKKGFNDVNRGFNDMMDVDVDLPPPYHQVRISLASNIPDLVITQPRNKANTTSKAEEMTRNIIMDGGCCFSSSSSSSPHTNELYSWILDLEDTEEVYEAISINEPA
ncbi:hypothetical protein EYR36_010705 [Pleurotus pulmonarius]|nr:hypothetical protein EYR36_010705 [Pleurotus pulmonarius]